MKELPESVRRAADVVRSDSISQMSYSNHADLLQAARSLADYLDPPPKTITREITYPEPLIDILEGQMFMASIVTEEFFYTVSSRTYSLSTIERFFKRGLLHATREAAIAHGKALAGVSDE